jgi:hypothetical protein
MVKTSPEVEAMQTKPHANLPDGSWNPAYGKWRYWKNREEELRKSKAHIRKKPENMIENIARNTGLPSVERIG